MITDPLTLPYCLTVEETAELLRTTVHAVYQMHHRGQLPGAFRRGPRLLVLRDRLLRSISESCRSPSKRKRKAVTN